MSRPNPGVAASVVGVSSAVIAFGTESGPVGIVKALLVGVCSGWLGYGLANALASVDAVKSQVDVALHELRQSSSQLPAVVALESNAAGQGPWADSGRLSREFVSSFEEPLRGVRSFALSAISTGLAGSLLGILIVSIGIHLSKSEYVSVSAIAAWWGGAVVSAVVGLGASAMVKLKLAELDLDLRSIERLVESRARELLVQNPRTSEDKTALLVSQAISQAFLQATDLWESLTIAAKTVQQGGTAIQTACDQLQNASERLAEQTEVANRVAWQLNSTAVSIGDTGKTTAESGRLLQEVFTQLAPVFRGVQSGMESLDKSVAALYPALESARDLQLTIKAADLVFRNIDQQVSGISASLRDEMTNASAKLILHQQNALADGVGPALKTIGHTMDLLLLLIDRSEQLLRNLPLAVPAKRIVDDLAAAGAKHLASAERDAVTVHEVSLRLAESEARMEAVLLDLRSAHTEIAGSLKALGSETAEISRTVGEVTAHLEGPFWKKLGGRKQ